MTPTEKSATNAGPKKVTVHFKSVGDLQALVDESIMAYYTETEPEDRTSFGVSLFVAQQVWRNIYGGK